MPKFRFLPLCLLVATAGAQSTKTANTWVWQPVSAAGVAGRSLGFGITPPTFYTLHAVTTGTAPTTCSWEAESSPDNVNWDAGSGSITGTQTCAAVGVVTVPVTYHVAPWLRINVTAFTGGDATTKVTFYLTRGVSQ